MSRVEKHDRAPAKSGSPGDSANTALGSDSADSAVDMGDSSDPVDTGSDTGELDTALADTSPADTAPIDTAPIDTAPIDTGTPLDLDADLDAIADLVLIGEEKQDAFWDMAVAGGGDHDADGQVDLLVGMPGREGGRVYVVDSSLRGTVDLGAITTTLSGAWGKGRDFAGIGLASTGDLDADGIDDLIVGASGDGGSEDATFPSRGAYVVYGPVTGSVELTAATGLIYGVADATDGSPDDDNTGRRLATPGDVDGDGVPDVLVSAYCYYLCSGAAYLFRGPVLGTNLTTAADMQMYDGFWLGYEVAAAGDTDGDGLQDFMLSNQYSVLLLLGPKSGVLDPTDADARFDPVRGYDLSGGLSPLGDADGDGYGDVLIGDSSIGDISRNGGGGWTFHGPFSGVVSTASAAAQLVGSPEGGYAGEAVASGDFNGDFETDFLLGAPDPYYVSVSAAYVVFGPVSGTVLLDDANAIVSGDGGDEAGFTVANVGDTDEDGRDDMLIGGPGDKDGGASAGKAWFVLGDSLR